MYYADGQLLRSRLYLLISYRTSRLYTSRLFVLEIEELSHSIPTQPEVEVIISEFHEEWCDGIYIWKLSWPKCFRFFTIGLWDTGCPSYILHRTIFLLNSETLPLWLSWYGMTIDKVYFIYGNNQKTESRRFSIYDENPWLILKRIISEWCHFRVQLQYVFHTQL